MMLGGAVRACPNTSSTPVTPAARASEPRAVVFRTSRRVCGMRASICDALCQKLLNNRLVDVLAAVDGDRSVDDGVHTRGDDGIQDRHDAGGVLWTRVADNYGCRFHR